MQHRFNMSMEVTCNRNDVLAALKKNKDEHKAIVEEARAGYLKAAEAALLAKLGKLKEGKLVALSFTLSPPQDYTSYYGTVIQMLEMHTEPTITLNSDEVRQFIQNKWDWSQQFYASNSAYSGTATRKLAELED